MTDAEVQHRHPVWRFGMLDREWPVCTVTVAHLDEVHEKLGSFETQRLNEIWRAGSQNKMYSVGDLPRATVDRLVAIGKDDEDYVHTLRLMGAFRVGGILREHVFHVLWIDPEHKIWPSKKKNT